MDAIVSRTQATPLQLPLSTCSSYGDIERFIEEDPQARAALKLRVQESIRIDPEATMSDLKLASHTLRLALAGAYGTSCYADITEMTSRFQTLTKKSGLALDSFVIGSVEALRYHQAAHTLVKKSKVATAMKFLQKVVSTAEGIVATAGDLVKDSEELVTMGHMALLRSVTEKTKAHDDEKKATETINEWKAKEARLRKEREKLKEAVTSAERDEHKAFEEAIRQRLRDASLIGFLEKLVLGRKFDHSEHAVQVRAARLKLQQQERAACADLAESLTRLENAHIEKSEIEQTVVALDIAVKALGKAKTAFENTQYYWETIQNRAQKLITRANDMGDYAEFEDMLSAEIVESGFAWMTLGHLNYMASKGMLQVEKTADEVMSALPTKDEARQLISNECARVKEQLALEMERRDAEILAAGTMTPTDAPQVAINLP